MAGSNKWQFRLDRGGTFTDIVALRPDGSLETAKLLSENPEQYALGQPFPNSFFARPSVAINFLALSFPR